MWAPELLKQAGEHLDYVAIHMMGMSPRRNPTLLRGNRYQKDPAAAWEELLELSGVVEQRVAELEHVLAAQRARQKIAITEGHLSMVPHNANPILLEWLSAAYHARSMNIYHRHGAQVRITTGADFAGNRWTVNAVLMQTPRGVSFLTPAGSIMRLFKRHNGKQGVAVQSAPPDLDIAASRSGNRVFLHVLNKSFGRAVEAGFAVAGDAGDRRAGVRDRARGPAHGGGAGPAGSVYAARAGDRRGGVAVPAGVCERGGAGDRLGTAYHPICPIRSRMRALYSSMRCGRRFRGDGRTAASRAPCPRAMRCAETP